jgi:hypothetical protein
MAHIEWNKAFRAVEVDSISSGHFLISSLPTMIGTLEEAITFCNRNRGWKLPGRKEAAALAKHRRRINACLKANGRPQICRRSMLWTDEYPWLAELRGYPVLCIFMASGSFYEESSDDRNEFRMIYPIR